MPSTLFTDLSAMLKHSPLVTLSIAREGNKLRVVITPKHPGKLDEDDKVESHEAALVTPLSVLGTATELDEGFTDELKRYLTVRETLVSEVADFEEEMTAAKLTLRAKTGESKGKRGATALPAKAPAPALEAPAAPAVPTTGPAAALAGL